MRRGRSRREALGLLAAGATGALTAGCLGGGSDGSEAATTDPAAWRDVDEIRLQGRSLGWSGVAPDPIAGVQNPTLVLVAGREYDLTWENLDGRRHNVELWTADDTVLERTEMMAEAQGTQTLSFEATDAVARYLCRPHRTSMVGDVEVVAADES